MPTTCGYCSVGCGMFIGVKDGRAVSVRGNPDHPVNRGLLCPKGLSRARHDSRRQPRALSAAARRERPHATRVSLGSTRIDTMAAQFRDVQAAVRSRRGRRHQHRAARHRGVLRARQAGRSSASARATTTATRRCACPPPSPATSGRSAATARPGAYEDLEQRRRHRADRRQHRRQPSDSLAAPRSANPNTTLIVVDPRVTKTAMLADLHLPLRPRSDLALINGLIHILIEHDLIDRDYIARAHDRLRRAARVGARLHARARRGDHRPLAGADLPDRVDLRATPRAGVHRLDDGREPQHEGHRDRQRDQQPRADHRQHRPRRAPRRSRSPASATRWARAKPASRRSCPATASSRAPTDREELAGTLERAGRSHSRRRAASPTPTSSRRRSIGTIRALWIIATNPIVSFPNLGVLKQALETSSSSSCRTAFTRRRPRELAHLVLPAAIWGEKEGTYTNSERRVSKVNRAVDAAGRGAVRLRHLPRSRRGARRAATSCFPGWTKPGGRLRGVEARVGGPPVRLLGHDLRAIEQHGGIQWPFPAGDADAAATRRLYADGRFQTDDGKARLIPSQLGAVPRAAERRVPVRAQHRPHRRALAHAHEDRERADSRTAVAEGLGGDEPARRAARCG